MKLSFLPSTLSTIIIALSFSPETNAQKGGVMKTKRPTSRPSSKPSRKPSARPSANPSQVPSALPSQMPSGAPSLFPSSTPSDQCAPLEKAYGLFISAIEQCEGENLNVTEEGYLTSELMGLANPYLNCIDTADGVKSAIDTNQELIVLCPTEIALSSPIRIDYKRFDMRCLTEPSATTGPACVFNGGSTNQLFTATTGGENVKFYGIGFKNGKSSTLTGGGAIDLFGPGQVELNSCQFDNNAADTVGGAMSVSGLAVAVVTNTEFKNNKSGSPFVSFSKPGAPGRGGAVYVGLGSTLSVGTSTFTNNAVINQSSATVGRGPNIFQAANVSPAAIVNCFPGNSYTPTGSDIVKQTGFGTYTTLSC